METYTTKKECSADTWLLVFCLCVGGVAEAEEGVVKIGALVDFQSPIGRVAMQAIQLAIRDVNQHFTNISYDKLLHLRMLDANCTAFQAAAAAVELFKNEVVAIAGPQSSAAAHFVAQLASLTQVPLVSYAATDPTLSQSQYPFLLRTTFSDSLQMAAIAAFIDHYGWEDVIALHSDDDYGTHGIAALRTSLENVGSRILRQTAFAPGLEQAHVRDLLRQHLTLETRVFIVHMQECMSWKLFKEAHALGMIDTGSVWIVTDMIATNLDIKQDFRKLTQGVIGIRPYHPDSFQFEYFLSEWKHLEQMEGNADSVINVYGMYAYDAVWLIANSICKYLEKGGNFEFEHKAHFFGDGETKSDLGQLKRFKGGTQLKEEILQAKFNGTTGIIELDKQGDRVGATFEIVNMVEKGLHVVGFWSQQHNFSIFPRDPKMVHRSRGINKSQQQLREIMWPGGSFQTPLGSKPIFTENVTLRIAIPRKTGYTDLVDIKKSSENRTVVMGFCIDVFETAIKYFPYPFPKYIYIPYGNNITPSYDDLIKGVSDKKFDAVVGDVTITIERMKLVDFTQPYIEASLAVLVPAKTVRRSVPFAFLNPFTRTMWWTIAAFLLVSIFTIWVLEHSFNPSFQVSPEELQHGRLEKLITVIWHVVGTIFFPESNQYKTAWGRIFAVLFLCFCLILNSSYTASLSSILTLERQSPTIKDIDSLLLSDDEIGYQTGSFVRSYLIQQNVAPERLHPFASTDVYAEVLSNGTVAAIVDERPYIDLFLGVFCNFTLAGAEFTKHEWGFAFQKGSRLANDMSRAILEMTRSGDMQRLHEYWFGDKGGCEDATSAGVASPELEVNRFWVPFLIWLGISFLCLIVSIRFRAYVEYLRTARHEGIPKFIKYLYHPTFHLTVGGAQSS